MSCWLKFLDCCAGFGLGQVSLGRQELSYGNKNESFLAKCLFSGCN